MFGYNEAIAHDVISEYVYECVCIRVILFLLSIIMYQ